MFIKNGNHFWGNDPFFIIRSKWSQVRINEISGSGKEECSPDYIWCFPFHFDLCLEPIVICDFEYKRKNVWRDYFRGGIQPIRTSSPELVVKIMGGAAHPPQLQVVLFRHVFKAGSMHVRWARKAHAWKVSKESACVEGEQGKHMHGRQARKAHAQKVSKESACAEGRMVGQHLINVWYLLAQRGSEWFCLWYEFV